MGSVAVSDWIVEHKLLHLHLQLLSTFVTITSDHSVFVNRCFGTTVLFGVQHHYWMGCSTITIRLLSNIWIWRAITSMCLQHSGFKRTTSIHTTFGILVFFLVLYHCGPRWLVGGEWILFSFYLSGNIIFWSFRFSVFYFSLSWHAGVGGQGRITFFLICPKEQFYKFCRAGRFVCFTVQGWHEVIFSFLSFLYWVGRTTGAGYFWWTCVWISISYLKRDHYLLFCLIGRERQLFWIWFLRASVFMQCFTLFPYTIIPPDFSLVPSSEGLVLSPISFYFAYFGRAYVSAFHFSVSYFFGVCVNTFDFITICAFSSCVYTYQRSRWSGTYASEPS